MLFPYVDIFLSILLISSTTCGRIESAEYSDTLESTGVVAHSIPASGGQRLSFPLSSSDTGTNLKIATLESAFQQTSRTPRTKRLTKRAAGDFLEGLVKEKVVELLIIDDGQLSEVKLENTKAFLKNAQLGSFESVSPHIDSINNQRRQRGQQPLDIDQVKEKFNQIFSHG